MRLIDKVTSGELTVAEAIEYHDKWKEQGDWFPANGGTETPFYTKSGTRLLYVYQPRSGKHAYLNMVTDMIIPNNEIGNYL